MISYKYGTVPIVNYTGGLVDTVVDIKKGGGGFLFHKYKSKDFLASIKRAKKEFDNKKAWRKLVEKISAYDFSWDAVAANYIDMYENI